MDSLGERLKQGREEKNISLEELSKATKISTSVLRALENDQHDVLPPEIYIRGFIRSYSRYVGLPEKELLKVWRETTDRKRIERSQERERAKTKADRTRLLLLLALFSVLVVLFIHNFFLNPLEEVKVSPEPRKEVRDTKADISSTKEKGILGAQKHSPASIPIRMVISCVSAKAWLEATIDNEKPFAMTLLEGDEVCWEGEKKIELRIGDAGGIRVTVNEIPLRPFGEAGEVVKLLFQGDTVSRNEGEPQKLDFWEAREQTTTG